MAIPTTVTYGGLNLNSGPTSSGIGFTVLDGFDPGERIRTWSEFRGYAGAVLQYNITEANLIPMRIPLLAKESSLNGLLTLLGKLNAIIDGGPTTFIYNDGAVSTTYNCAWSSRPTIPRDSNFQTGFWVKFELVLNRYPE